MQKTLHKIGLAVPTLVLALTTAATVPVFAQHDGSADSTTTTNSTETEQSGSTSGSNNEVATTTGTETESSNTPENETELHSQGSTLVKQLREQHKSNKTEAEKAKACEQHRHGLQTKFTRITTNSQSLETKIGVFLTRAQTYKTTNNVDVANWTTLVSTATDAKTKVDASIANLIAVTPKTVDCSSSTVADDVATFKTAAQQVRTDLQAYKTAVKNVFVALQNAKNSTNTTEGSNQ